MNRTHTTTYVTLDVAPSTFADVKKRLEEAGALNDYLDKQDGGELLVLGTLALKVEVPEGPFKVMLNGKEHTFVGQEVSYASILKLTNPSAPEDSIISITYSHAYGPKKEGILSPGQAFWVDNGTHINAYFTGNA